MTRCFQHAEKEQLQERLHPPADVISSAPKVNRKVRYHTQFIHSMTVPGTAWKAPSLLRKKYWPPFEPARRPWRVQTFFAKRDGRQSLRLPFPACSASKKYRELCCCPSRQLALTRAEAGVRNEGDQLASTGEGAASGSPFRDGRRGTSITVIKRNGGRSGYLRGTVGGFFNQRGSAVRNGLTGAG